MKDAQLRQAVEMALGSTYRSMESGPQVTPPASTFIQILTGVMEARGRDDVVTLLQEVSRLDRENRMDEMFGRTGS